MFTLALRGVKMNLGRYVATLVAIMTGVAFFAASGFMADRVTDALEGNARDQYSGVDAAVIADEDSEASGSEFAARYRISADVADDIAALPEVAAVAGHLTGSVAFLADDGATFADDATGRTWVDDDELNHTDIVEGVAPAASGEIVVDRATVDDEDLAVGQSVTLLTLAGPEDVTIVGITEFGENAAQDDGGTVSVIDDDAFVWLNSGQREYDDIYVRGEGSQDDLVAAIEPLVPPGMVVQAGDDFVQDRAAAAGAIGGILKRALQAFSLIALLVGGFVIVNTFTVIVAQRMRELAVLSAIGATPKQLRRSLRWEGLLIGLLGSVLGVALGFALTYLLILVISLFGVDLPGSGLAVSPAVVIQGIVLGTVITFLSVMRPARKAGRVEPIEALRESAVESKTLTQQRVITVAVLVGGGAAGLLIAPSAGLVVFSALAFFIGVILAGPVIALGASRVFKPAIAPLGLEGRLAADNIGRNPRRTATTANALLIGVFLVTLVTVSGTSLKDFAVDKIDALASADFTMSSDGGTVDDQLVDDLEAIDDVERVIPFRTETVAQQDDEGGIPHSLSTGDLTALSEVANINVDEGTEVANLAAGEVLVVNLGENTPEIGTTVTYVDSAGDTAEFTVAGTIGFSLDAIRLGNIATPESFDAFVGDTAPTAAFIDAKDATESDVEDEIEAVTNLRPDITLEAGNVFSVLVGQIFDFMINAVNGLLLMSVVVALIGIVNTMSLSIIERRRELGLLRIVGMVDRRVRRMVRIESILIAALGTVSGVVMGAFMGFSLVFAIDRLSSADIGVDFAPFQLVIVLVAGVVLGYVAALIPAMRSTKPEVLDAIQVT